MTKVKCAKYRPAVFKQVPEWMIYRPLSPQQDLPNGRYIVPCLISSKGLKTVLKLMSIHFSKHLLKYVSFQQRIERRSYSDNDGNLGYPLILTPLIEAGKIKEAQKASKVKPMKGKIISYSGFFTVNKLCHANMFFWFIPALHNSETAPLLIWLQGGPGASLLFGLFNENGPFSLTTHGLKLRKYTWTTSHSVLYIDNPIGAGFSFTKNDCGYSINEEQIGCNLYSAVLQFFKLFPQFQKKDLFITGESYAGKYIPALAHTIFNRNPTADLKINLKGVAIGNAPFDLENMLHYGDFLYQIGLLDTNGKALFHKKESKILSYIQQKKWAKAFLEFEAPIFGGFVNPTIFRNLIGLPQYFNYLYTGNEMEIKHIVQFIKNSRTRMNLHVGNTKYNFYSVEVEKHLHEDIMQSVKPWFEEMVENYNILLHNGQLDIIVAYPLIESFVDALNCSGSAVYKRAPVNQWHVKGDLAGYWKKAKNLTVVLVRNAGHLVLLDQPKWAVDMITKFTRNEQL